MSLPQPYPDRLMRESKLAANLIADFARGAGNKWEGLKNWINSGPAYTPTDRFKYEAPPQKSFSWPSPSELSRAHQDQLTSTEHREAHPSAFRTQLTPYGDAGTNLAIGSLTAAGGLKAYQTLRNRGGGGGTGRSRASGLPRMPFRITPRRGLVGAGLALAGYGAYKIPSLMRGAANYIDGRPSGSPQGSVSAEYDSWRARSRQEHMKQQAAEAAAAAKTTREHKPSPLGDIYKQRNIYR